ncbi:hypothetical protein AB6A40_001380 [Gnathostoma spinigerum]|uniref:Uncharacterized protein n=1 Tax=Gnathostoma spinigerum TaxID=75299 RepID=A0ABD6E698_9BILA
MRHNITCAVETEVRSCLRDPEALHLNCGPHPFIMDPSLLCSQSSNFRFQRFLDPKLIIKLRVVLFDKMKESELSTIEVNLRNIGWSEFVAFESA